MTSQPPALTVTPTVGDILVSSWGYDQTNIDYYQVVRVTRATVTVRPIAAAAHSLDNGWTGTVAPLPDQFTGEAMRRKIQHGWSGGWGVRIDDVANAWTWDGTPQRYSTYA